MKKENTFLTIIRQGKNGEIEEIEVPTQSMRKEKKKFDIEVEVIKEAPREETESSGENQSSQTEEQIKTSENSESDKIESAFEKRYVSDVIGSDYKEWENRDIVLITAPTGSGKSHFILYVFLKWIIEQDKQNQEIDYQWDSNQQIPQPKVLYLVNRKVLKKQFEEELNRDVEDELFECLQNSGKNLNDYITFSTYQSIEKGLTGDSPRATISFLQQFCCVIYDEAHYFYSDSDFNTNTALSFDCLRKEFDCKLQVFISATMGKLKEYLKKDKPVYLPFENTCLHPIPMINPGHGHNLRTYKERFISYEVEKDYNYVEVDIVENIQDLANNIQYSSAKWLIFVDSIPVGKEFMSLLINGNEVKEKDVVFIDAEYQKDCEASKVIDELAIKDYISRRIVIATAVIDNGVSFHDKQLRNIAIMADTEETFIQMLGRKRQDGLKLNLYICKRGIDHFSRRYESAKRKLDFWKKYKNTINEIYDCYEFAYPPAHIQKYCKMQIKPYTDLYHRTFPHLLVKTLYGELQLEDYRRIVNYENRLQKQRVIDDILHENSSEYKCMCYFVGGLIAFNNFSIQKCNDLKNFYIRMKNKLETDEDAFIKQQLEWLGLSSDMVNCVIRNYSDKLREQIKDILNPILDRELSTEEKNELTGKVSKESKNKSGESLSATNLSGGLLSHFINELPCDLRRKLISRKKDRGLSEEDFNACMEQADLPYRMKRIEKSKFVIFDISVSQDESVIEEPEN